MAQFLGDARHHLGVAIERDQVVGFASGVHYVHPDKPSEMWIQVMFTFVLDREHRISATGRRRADRIRD